MNQRQIPAFLHEVFGEKQSILTIVIILMFGGGLATALSLQFPVMYQGIPLWRGILAFILIFDIIAGCLANFTASTSNYYATRGGKRWIFISVHVHILLVALLLGTGLWPSFAVWLYTVTGAAIVNAIRGSNQLFIGGLLLSLGIGWLPMLASVEPYMLIISLLFMVKVLFSFSVNHYGAKG